MLAVDSTHFWSTVIGGDCLEYPGITIGIRYTWPCCLHVPYHLQRKTDVLEILEHWIAGCRLTNLLIFK